MRALLILLPLLLAACVKQEPTELHIPSVPPSQRATIDDATLALRQWNAAKYPEDPFERVEVVRVDATLGWFAAIYDWDDRWWGSACFMRIQDGRIAALEEIPDLTEQSMYSIRPVTLQGFETPVVEILGKTHMGNGSIYLFELTSGKPHLMLKTCAVDFNQGWEVLANGVLERDYCDLNSDGKSDLVMSGVALLREQIREVDDGGTAYYVEGPTWPGKELVRKAFVFNPLKGSYDELVSWRTGPTWYHG